MITIKYKNNTKVRTEILTEFNSATLVKPDRASHKILISIFFTHREQYHVYRILFETDIKHDIILACSEPMFSKLILLGRDKGKFWFRLGSHASDTYIRKIIRIM